MSSILERKRILEQQQQQQRNAAASPQPSTTSSTSPTPAATAPVLAPTATAAAPVPAAATTLVSAPTTSAAASSHTAAATTALLVSQYQALINWTLKSIDIYRNQLLPLCFVCFAQTYAALRRAETETEASEFFAKHSLVHLAAHKQVLQDVNALLLSTAPEQTSIFLSREVKQLLLQFLAKDRAELLALVNEFCALHESPSTMAMLPQQQQALCKVRLGVPKRLRLCTASTIAEEEVVVPDLNSAYWKNLADKVLPPPAVGLTPTPESASRALLFPSIAMMNFAHAEGLISAASADQGRAVALGFEDGSVRVWNTAQSSSTQRLVSHSQPVLDLSMHGADRLLSCSLDGTVRYWQNAASSSSTPPQFKNLLRYAVPNAAWCVSFAPISGHYFATGARDGTCKLFSLEHSTEALRVFTSHGADVDCLAWHANLHYLFTGSADARVRMFDINAASCARSFACSGAVDRVVADPSGRFVAAALATGEVRIFDINTERQLQRIALGAAEEVHSMSWNEGGNFLALALGSNQVAILDTSEDAIFAPHDMTPRVFASNSSSIVHVNFIKNNILLAAGTVTRSF